MLGTEHEAKHPSAHDFRHAALTHTTAVGGVHQTGSEPRPTHDQKRQIGFEVPFLVGHPGLEPGANGLRTHLDAIGDDFVTLWRFPIHVVLEAGDKRHETLTGAFARADEDLDPAPVGIAPFMGDCITDTGLESLGWEPGEPVTVTMTVYGRRFPRLLAARRCPRRLGCGHCPRCRSDANLATGQQLFDRPDVSQTPPRPPLDLRPVAPGALPYAWDPVTGLSRRLIPGQPGGTGVTTSLNHDRDGKACYDSERNQRGHAMRSRKLAALQRTLKSPEVYGPGDGDLLLVGWGSTRGAIEEAVDMARAEGLGVWSLHVQFLSPLPPGLADTFAAFKKVITVELNYSDDWEDPLITRENRRYGQLAWLLRAATLLDIDCVARVPGRPLMPLEIVRDVRRILDVRRDTRHRPSASASAKGTSDHV